MNIIVMGPPAAGKGTTCKFLSEKLNLEHISTGDLLRKEQAARSKIGLLADRLINDGKYMPDDIVITMVKNHMINTKGKDGFLFDGFPRTKEQAKQIHSFLLQRKSPIDVVLLLEVDDNVAIGRVMARAEKEGRVDDNEKAIRQRLLEYNGKTAPLVSFFEGKGVLQRISSNGSIDDMCEAALSYIQLI